MRGAPLIPALGFLLGMGVVMWLPEDQLFISPQDPAAEANAERWACPMMCFIGNKPGTCPVCGMTMTRVEAGELQREQARRIGLETAQVFEGPAVLTVRGYGAAAYDNRFTRVVIPRVAGRIVARHMATWGCCETVEEGAPVIDLYSPEVIAAQGELQAAARLGDRALADALRARFVRWNLEEVAEAVLAGEPIRETVTIRSPFSGRVMLAEFEMVNEALAVGREVSPDTPLLRIVDPDRLTLVVHIPETRARFLREGQTVHIDSDDLGPLPQLRARIDRLGNEIAMDTRTREVRIHIEGANGLLFPGSLVSARIQAALGPDLRPADPTHPDTWGRFTLIPKAAVLSTGVRHIAWRVASRSPDGRIRFRPAALTLGPRIEDEHGNDLYIVRAGISPGDEVATQGAFLIDSQAQLAGTESLLHVAPPARTGGGAHAH